MTKLSYVRIVTYALFLIAAWMLTHGYWGSGIPVQMTTDAHDFQVRLALERMRLDDAVLEPRGFRATTRSGSEVMKLAVECLRANKVDPTSFNVQFRVYDAGSNLSWYVIFTMDGAPHVYRVTVNDKTGEARFEDHTAPI